MINFISLYHIKRYRFETSDALDRVIVVRRSVKPLFDTDKWQSFGFRRVFTNEREICHDADGEMTFLRRRGGDRFSLISSLRRLRYRANVPTAEVKGCTFKQREPSSLTSASTSV